MPREHARQSIVTLKWLREISKFEGENLHRFRHRYTLSNDFSTPFSKREVDYLYKKNSDAGVLKQEYGLYIFACYYTRFCS